MFTLDAPKFWKFFHENHQAYLFLGEVDDHERERLVNLLLEKLHEFCDQLYFEIGGHPEDPKQELIITASGNPQFFPIVEALVQAAPEMDDWEVIAFKPPRGASFVIVYNDIELTPTELWFTPLRNKEEPKMIGIAVGVPYYDEDNEDENFNAAIFALIETVIGEKAFALVDYIEPNSLPEDPEEYGLEPLERLTEYLHWQLQQFEKGDFS